MRITISGIVDLKNRLWINNQGKLELDDRRHPPLSHEHPVIDDYTLTLDGKIYNNSKSTCVSASREISQFRIVDDNIYALEDGCLGSIELGDTESQWSYLYWGVEYLVDAAPCDGHYPDNTDDRILIIDSNRMLNQVNARTTDSEFELLKLDNIIKVTGDAIITSDSVISIRRVTYNDRDVDELWRVNVIPSPANIVDAVRVDWINDLNYKYIMLDCDGNLFSYNSKNIACKACQNTMIIEFNARCKWVKLVKFNIDHENTEDMFIGLVNEIGEIYQINYKFIASSTNLPTSIFSNKSDMKNARTSIN